MGVRNSHPITKQTDFDFLFLLQRSVLLGLKESTMLNEMQLRQAEAVLLRQYREDRSMYSRKITDD